jgi:acyl carrier protein
MVPAQYVVAPSLPRGPHGKLDRRALAALDIPVETQALTAPRTPVETVMAEIWKEVLGVEQVSINDNFFHLGGHSLLMMQIVARIRQQFNLEVSLRTLFEQPTIAGVAADIARIQQRSAPAAAERPGRLDRALLPPDLAGLSADEVDSLLTQLLNNE